MKKLLCLSFWLLWSQAQSQSLRLVDQKHFYGIGPQVMEELLTTPQGESYALMSFENQLRYTGPNQQLFLTPPNSNVEHNLVLIKLNAQGHIAWHTQMYANQEMTALDMIQLDSMGILVLFRMKGLGYFDIQNTSQVRGASTGDYVMALYDTSGSVIWHRGFGASLKPGIFYQDGYLEPLDSGRFLVALNTQGSIDADLSSGVANTPDGGGLNTHILEYDHQANYRSMISWTSAGEIIIQEMAAGPNGRLLVALRNAGTFDVDPSSGVTNLTATYRGAQNYWQRGNVLAAVNRNTLNLDWYFEMESRELLMDYILKYDALKNQWWFCGRYMGNFVTFDTPGFSRNRGASAYDYDAFFLAYDLNGNRTYEGELTANVSSEIPTSFIPHLGNYYLLSVVGNQSDLDFTPNRTHLGPRQYTGGMLIAKHNLGYGQEWAYKRMEYPSSNNYSVYEQELAVFGTDDLLMGFTTRKPNTWQKFSVNLAPQLDTANALEVEDDALLVRWQSCAVEDTALLYNAGTFSASDTTADHYEWVRCIDDQVLASGPDPFYSPQYRVQLYMRYRKGFCEYRSDCVIANDIGLEELDLPLQIYPNPSQGAVKFEYQGRNPLKLDLYNLQGQRLESLEILPGTSLQNLQYAPGLYLLRPQGHPKQQYKLMIR